MFCLAHVSYNQLIPNMCLCGNVSVSALTSQENNVALTQCEFRREHYDNVHQQLSCNYVHSTYSSNLTWNKTWKIVEWKPQEQKWNISYSFFAISLHISASEERNLKAIKRGDFYLSFFPLRRHTRRVAHSVMCTTKPWMFAGSRVTTVRNNNLKS